MNKKYIVRLMLEIVDSISDQTVRRALKKRV